MRALGPVVLRGHALRLLRRQHGQSAVELALVMPLLLILLTGIWTYGMAINNLVVLQEATGAGTRQFAIMRGESGDPCALAASTIAADAPVLANTGSTSTGLGFTMTINGQPVSGATATATPQCPNASLTAGQPVAITATYPCTLKLFRIAAVSNCYLNVANTEVLQ